MTKEKMPTSIEKHLGQRLGMKRVIDNFVNKIEAANEDDLVHLETLLDKLEEKVTSLKIINEKILSLTDAVNIAEEIVEREEYIVDVEVKLRRHNRRLLRLNGTRNREAQATTLQTSGSGMQPLDAEIQQAAASHAEIQQAAASHAAIQQAAASRAEIQQAAASHEDIPHATDLRTKERSVGSITSRELRSAERLLLQRFQATECSNEITSLKAGISRQPLVKQLRLFFDSDKIIRCGGRINNAPVSVMTKFPILLPKKHHLTRLIVQDAHRLHLHSGINATVTHIRQKYWIHAIRQCAQAVIRKCVTCRPVVGKPYIVPDPPPLPMTQVLDTPPFTVTGVDFRGAL